MHNKSPQTVAGVYTKITIHSAEVALSMKITSDKTSVLKRYGV